jgi:hypothetical protein
MPIVLSTSTRSSVPPTSTSAQSYVHVQHEPSTVWTVSHRLGWYPNVSAVDAQGISIEGHVVHATNQQLTITWSEPVAGTAYAS